MLVTDKFVFFYGGPFSNFADAHFNLNGMKFNCSEQYFMYRKAMQFNDIISTKKIMTTDDPYKQKRLGKKVVGFDADIWAQVRYDAMLDGLRAKFKIPEFQEALILTGNRTIVEASPFDTIWGIGLCADDPRALHPDQWLGENLLGKALMQVREEINGGLI